MGSFEKLPKTLRRIVAYCRANYGLEPNGDVRPCFFHPVIGNTAGTTLGAVLNRPQAIAFRESLRVADNPICRRCVCSLYVKPSVPRRSLQIPDR
jgi:MoaA/NifB/PqqE/SkfB family radical SAM enzyme